MELLSYKKSKPAIWQGRVEPSIITRKPKPALRIVMEFKSTPGLYFHIPLLREKYREGLYLIRPYTKWNLNFGVDFLFESYIQVFSTSKEEKGNPISNANR